MGKNTVNPAGNPKVTDIRGSSGYTRETFVRDLKKVSAAKPAPPKK